MSSQQFRWLMEGLSIEQKKTDFTIKTAALSEPVSVFESVADISKLTILTDICSKDIKWSGNGFPQIHVQGGW